MIMSLTPSIVMKFRRLPRTDRLLVIEAAATLILASLVIAVLPFRSVGRLASLRTRRSEPSFEARANAIKRIRWAVTACARRLPWRAMCFEQGFAAQRMLRRRGIPSVLHFGAARNKQEGLAAHVWVRDGDVDVIGGELAPRFAVLATFPPENAHAAGKQIG